ncbi:ferritin-like protein [Streptomyces sp. NPDC094032]|uniref:ferritin-like domain-containing protein n=1 Tax=Streptomyces sp. NPDC094032 TaxID=3155308 RepID=UPI00332AEF7D
MTTLPGYRSNRIVELMREPAERRGPDWLQDSLQQAVLLELATLPPYLCAMWSIQDEGDEVATALERVVFDEMSHLGLAGNLLTTIGGFPQLAHASTAPVYPGPLPGGVRPGLVVSLSGLSRESAELFSRIEEPDDPLVNAVSPGTSIGAFYTAILDAFRAHADLITGQRQLVRSMASHGAGNDIVAITSLNDAAKAIDVIKEQGEGTTASPENPFHEADGELAHYYVFREIYHGRKLVKVSEDPPRWDFTGDPIPLPATRHMATVPPGGWAASGAIVPDSDAQQRLTAGNQTYSRLLSLLEQAWKTDAATTASQLLGKAVGAMFGLQGPAQWLMEHPLPDGSGMTYGPEFRFVETPVP